MSQKYWWVLLVANKPQARKGHRMQKNYPYP